MPIIHFKSMFKIKILWFLEDDLLESTDTSYWHLYTNHDFKY